MEIIYKLKQGDTLSNIAKKFNTTAAHIKQTNRLNTDVYEGLRILIREVGKLHTVRPFETLDGVANYYNVSVVDICKINELTSTYIFCGQKLIIPV